MDFAVLPPEINSGLMYAGPGSGTLVAASAAWDQLAADLQSTAAGYGSVISGLTGSTWQGPASQAMAAAAAPHVSWLSATAGQAEQASAQAQAAVAAYEAAFAGTVPPPVIAANRALLMALVATNFLGQNTPAIMATEAQYAEMWAQDATTMYGYAGAASAASTLTPLTPAPAVANPAGAAVQATSVAGTAGTAAATDTQAVLGQLTTAVPATLAHLATPAAATTTSATTSATDPITSMINSTLTGLGLNNLGFSTSSTGTVSYPAWWSDLGLPTNGFGWISDVSTFGSIGSSSVNGMQLGSWATLAYNMVPKAASAAANAALPALPNIVNTMPSLGGLGGLGGGAGAGVSAGLGNAGAIGALSVPQSWAGGAGSAAAPAATALPLSGEAAAAPEAAPTGSMLGGVPFTGGAGRGISGPGPRYGFQLSVVPHPPAAG